jgi:hypothetical protein
MLPHQPEIEVNPSPTLGIADAHSDECGQLDDDWLTAKGCDALGLLLTPFSFHGRWVVVWISNHAGAHGFHGGDAVITRSCSRRHQISSYDRITVDKMDLLFFLASRDSWERAEPKAQFVRSHEPVRSSGFGRTRSIG